MRVIVIILLFLIESVVCARPIRYLPYPKEKCDEEIIIEEVPFFGYLTEEGPPPLMYAVNPEPFNRYNLEILSIIEKERTPRVPHEEELKKALLDKAHLENMKKIVTEPDIVIKSGPEEDDTLLDEKTIIGDPDVLVEPVIEVLEEVPESKVEPKDSGHNDLLMFIERERKRNEEKDKTLVVPFEMPNKERPVVLPKPNKVIFSRE